jgi:hypothetical protein
MRTRPPVSCWATGLKSPGRPARPQQRTRIMARRPVDTYFSLAWTSRALSLCLGAYLGRGRLADSTAPNKDAGTGTTRAGRSWPLDIRSTTPRPS